ncbi:DUF1189 family protein [Solibacillus sp. FSL H8-0538]|uniref:DUF1189 family protein n=1 Tax=Solibacillus sp. FSL H8-0538 TaxID=2921400 RepID=UPI0030F5EF5B
MKISHMQLLVDSLIHPKKLAAYRIMSIGKVIQYVFLLILLVTAFSLGQFITTGAQEVFNYEEIEQYATDLKWLVYPIAAVLLFVMNSLIMFAKISFYAFACSFLLKPMNRRGEYRQIWRTTAFAITWATLLSIVFAIFPVSSKFITIVSIFITMMIVIVALTKYPLLKR